MKKRQVNDPTLAVAEQADPFSQDNGMGATNVNAELARDMPVMVQALNGDDDKLIFEATQQFRKLLSVEKDPPIADVINANIVPRFVQLLTATNPHLQFEAAWVLTNIASGTAEQTKVVVQNGALPLFVGLLRSPNEDVREQAVWALGNIAGDCPHFRDLVLNSGGLGAIMQLVAEASKPGLLRNATWTLSNLCRGKPPPPLEWVTPALPTFAQLINQADVEVLTDASWALSYLTDGSNDRISAVLQAGVCHRVVELLSHGSAVVQTPALRAVGNIVTGDDNQTQTMLEAGVLAPLFDLLDHKKKNIRKECCWTISNITAGNKSQIEDVIKAGLIPRVIGILEKDEFDVKKEAAWAISNATAGGNAQHIEYLATQGCIAPLCSLLGHDDTKMQGVALDALSNILRVGKTKQQELQLPENPIVTLIEQCDGMKALEEVQHSGTTEIYSKASKILESFFPLEDDDIDGEMRESDFNFGDATIPQGGFNFGA